MRHLLRVGLLLIPGFSLGKEIEECCKRKIVGDDIYNFIKQVGEAKSEFGCMNDCVYSIEGKPDSMFCFRSGDQRAVCQDSSDSTDSTDSTGSTDLTDLTDECFIDENTDYPGMDLNPETGRTTDRRDSALACRDLCNQNKDCKYFGWKAHSRECWLKTGISKKVVQIGTTSGTACRTECLPGWSQFESKCYKIFEEKKPWKEAQAICQEEGSNLASIISSSNNKFIEELIVKTPVEYPWIGAYLFSAELKEFKWIDGTPFVYQNWDTDQPIYNPREGCVEFVNGKWHDFPCDFPRAFICQKIEGLKNKKLAATCDDIITVYFDGDEALQGENWRGAFTVDVPAATKVIGIACEDLVGRYGIVASTDSGIVTDDTWVCSSKYVDGWNKPGFQDTNNDFSLPSKGIQYTDGSQGLQTPPAGIAAEAKSLWGPVKNGWAYCKKEIISDCCTGQNEICEDSYLGEGSDVYHFLKDCGNGCYCYYDPLNFYG